MLFINTSEATQKPSDPTENGKCTNVTNRRSRAFQNPWHKQTFDMRLLPYPVGNTVNTSFPTRRDITATSCSSFDLNSLWATTLKSAKALASASTSTTILVVFTLLQNPSFCPINQSEFCGHQRPQKWTNRGLYSRRSFPPSPLPDPPFFARILFLLPYPLPFLRLLRRLLFRQAQTGDWSCFFSRQMEKMGFTSM